MNHSKMVMIFKGKAGMLGKSQRQIANETGISRTLINLYFQRHINLLEEDIDKILVCLGLDKNPKVIASCGL